MSVVLAATAGSVAPAVPVWMPPIPVRRALSVVLVVRAATRGPAVRGRRRVRVVRAVRVVRVAPAAPARPVRSLIPTRSAMPVVLVVLVVLVVPVARVAPEARPVPVAGVGQVARVAQARTPVPPPFSVPTARPVAPVAQAAPRERAGLRGPRMVEPPVRPATLDPVVPVVPVATARRVAPVHPPVTTRPVVPVVSGVPAEMGVPVEPAVLPAAAERGATAAPVVPVRMLEPRRCSAPPVRRVDWAVRAVLPVRVVPLALPVAVIQGPWALVDPVAREAPAAGVLQVAPVSLLMTTRPEAPEVRVAPVARAGPVERGPRTVPRVWAAGAASAVSAVPAQMLD